MRTIFKVWEYLRRIVFILDTERNMTFWATATHNGKTFRFMLAVGVEERDGTVDDLKGFLQVVLDQQAVEIVMGSPPDGF